MYITASFILFQGNIIFPSLKQNLPHRCVQEILGVFHLALGKKTLCRSLGAEKNQWTNHIWGEEKFENFRGRGKKFIRVLEQKKVFISRAHIFFITIRLLGTLSLWWKKCTRWHLKDFLWKKNLSATKNY